ncbi:MAG TPA: 16S rRNA (cytidine(1402)-2'-O)-methyltransferase [Candidatus Paceibacterota bacterium]
MVLNVVATPIGNLKDITLRAKEVLESATLILAEDTRSIKKLLTLLDIPLGGKVYVSSHAQSTQTALQKAIEACVEHETIALVTDAGTPAISDPGSLFIHEFRTAYPQATVVPIPGVSAVVAALSVSGFPGNHFEFIGFVPHKKGRQTLFNTIAQTEHTVCMYESPHRILKTLEALAEVLGDRPILVGREMTKSFEEYPVGTAKELLEYYTDNTDKVRGEFVVVVAPQYMSTVQERDASDTIE